MTYQDRVNESFREFMDETGGEGNWRPPERTQEEIAEREIAIEEEIAIQILRQAMNVGLLLDGAVLYVKNIVSDRNATPEMDDESRALWLDYRTIKQKLANHGVSRNSIEYARQALYLAHEVVRFRESGISGQSYSTNIGAELAVTTSLAAAIVDFTSRVTYMVSWRNGEEG